ncbi:ubiquitin thioesterase otubain-like [Dendrobium catenatum]|uniref:ubiquitinyl hydrolase 1 n=1 Tax=Dendrobium catenatum TaxID=906689 RepID=A0A2I0WHF0_9ASPA|nr:ubiquitin thioesterase otubain-like [Dendrobium catenatum]XP_020683182.1 ubiquitin thioesterase otubain-like [Dendrobium catenatum]XP_020683183.1 ubiquitin thioesterase otubain-like [Dendrobium catenatum]PKU75085.1 Ubiquitin thioesterase otubain-like [Dendrobium catenatum]
MANQAEASPRKRKALESELGMEAAVATDMKQLAAEEAAAIVLNPSNSVGAGASGSREVFPQEYDWSCCRDDDIMQQQAAIREEAIKIPYVGDKEPLSSLAAEFESGNPILKEKIRLLSEQYAALRRTRGDGNCFYRSFMLAYLEHILETQDIAEAKRITGKVEQCKNTLQSLGYTEFTYEDFFSIFMEQLESVLQGKEASISMEELLSRSRDQFVSDYVVMFFRFVTSGEIRKRAEFFEPFIAGLTNTSVDQFCKSSVEPMGEECDHVHIIALSDALGVAIRVVYLDRSSCDKGALAVNHHDFVPTASADESTEPFVTLLYRPGHYDILYRR